MALSSSISATNTLRTVLRTPTALRLLLLQPQRQPNLRASYYSHEHPAEPPYRDTEARILSAALTHVPAHGFTQAALALGARDAGYLDISTNLFPRGAFELVQYYLVTQRLALAGRRSELFDTAASPTSTTSSSSSSSSSSSASTSPPSSHPTSVHQRVRTLVLARLHANAAPIASSSSFSSSSTSSTPTSNLPSSILPHWQQAVGLMSLAENIPASVRELALLSDEIWYLAGDAAVDGTWYGKRAGLAATYAAAELFQTTDRSEGFRDTAAFLDRRLRETRALGAAVGGVAEWIGFQGGALVGLLRSKGVRI